MKFTVTTLTIICSFSMSFANACPSDPISEALKNFDFAVPLVISSPDLANSYVTPVSYDSNSTEYRQALGDLPADYSILGDKVYNDGASEDLDLLVPVINDKTCQAALLVASLGDVDTMEVTEVSADHVTSHSEVQNTTFTFTKR